MAEIKSTLELALERTRKMSISDEEKEEIKRREMEAKATGWFHRYIEDRASLPEILRSFEQMDEKAAAGFRAVLLSKFLDALSMDENLEKVVGGIEALKGRSIGPSKQELESLRSEYATEKEKAEEQLRAEMETCLMKEGISGTAVVPRVEKTRAWTEKMEGLKQTFQRRADEIKKSLATL
jgi:hypothetical protein